MAQVRVELRGPGREARLRAAQSILTRLGGLGVHIAISAEDEGWLAPALTGLLQAGAATLVVAEGSGVALVRSEAARPDLGALEQRHAAHTEVLVRVTPGGAPLRCQVEGEGWLAGLVRRQLASLDLTAAATGPGTAALATPAASAPSAPGGGGIMQGAAPTSQVSPGEEHPEQDRPGQEHPEQDRPGQDRPGQDPPGQERPDLRQELPDPRH